MACLKVCGISLMLNQNIVKYTTAKGKHQYILIEHRWNINTFWVCNLYRSNAYLNGEEFVPYHVKICSIWKKLLRKTLPEASCFCLKFRVFGTQNITWYPHLGYRLKTVDTYNKSRYRNGESWFFIKFYFRRTFSSSKKKVQWKVPK